jgi:hypothetical protein
MRLDICKYALVRPPRWNLLVQLLDGVIELQHLRINGCQRNTTSSVLEHRMHTLLLKMNALSHASEATKAGAKRAALTYDCCFVLYNLDPVDRCAVVQSHAEQESRNVSKVECDAGDSRILQRNNENIDRVFRLH